MPQLLYSPMYRPVVLYLYETAAEGWRLRNTGTGYWMGPRASMETAEENLCLCWKSNINFLVVLPTA
jgi:hypothetical protein